MKTITNVKPLIVNFMVPESPKVVSAEEATIIYDPQSQITIYMGGNSSPTRSKDGYKFTREKDDYGYRQGNDAGNYTDD